jgi:hypothetical protein
MAVERYFGVCPTCHKTDGYLNIGREHWFFCKEHEFKWCAGANLFSSWMYETPEEQSREQEKLGFHLFAEVEPFYPCQQQDVSNNEFEDAAEL